MNARMETTHPSRSHHGSSSHHHHHHHQHHHGHHHQSKNDGHHHHKPRNYKLLMDPFLIKGSSKVYRYDGCIPNDPSYPPVQVRDPRSQLTRIWTRLEPHELPVPHFKVISLVYTLLNLKF